MDHRSRFQAETPILSKVRPTDATAVEARPRKANSEVRKQQNRIASRNYREKRKRKLQQLQQLLDDDNPGEKAAYARSTSPYDDRSCSGSTGYERSVASASPHIAAVTSSFSSPQPDHAAIASQTWSPPVTSATQALPYNDPYASPTQLATIYSQSGLATTTCPTWIAPPSTDSTVYSTMSSSHHYTQPSHTYSWPSSGFDTSCAYAVYQQQTAASSYTPSWQDHTIEEVPAGVVVYPYERSYYQHEPQ